MCVPTLASACPHRARHNADPLSSIGILDPSQIFGKQRYEATVNSKNSFFCQFFALQTSLIDPPLDLNVGLGLKLEVALFRLSAEVVVECPLDVHRMCVVSLDEIAIITIHGSYEVGQRLRQPPRPAGPGMTWTAWLDREPAQ